MGPSCGLVAFWAVRGGGGRGTSHTGARGEYFLHGGGACYTFTLHQHPVSAYGESSHNLNDLWDLEVPSAPPTLSKYGRRGTSTVSFDGTE